MLRKGKPDAYVDLAYTSISDEEGCGFSCQLSCCDSEQPHDAGCSLQSYAAHRLSGRKRLVLAGCTSGGKGFRIIVCLKRSLSWME